MDGPRRESRGAMIWLLAALLLALFRVPSRDAFIVNGVTDRMLSRPLAPTPTVSQYLRSNTERDSSLTGTAVVAIAGAFIAALVSRSISTVQMRADRGGGVRGIYWRKTSDSVPKYKLDPKEQFSDAVWLPNPQPFGWWHRHIRGFLDRYSSNRGKIRPLLNPRLPARMALHKIFKDRLLAKFEYSDVRIRKAKPAKLDFNRIKEVASYMQKPHEETLHVPAEWPVYQKPHTHSWSLEQEVGPKKPPYQDDEYRQYLGKLCTLSQAAEKVAGEAGMSLDHDIIADRDSLSALFNFVCGAMNLEFTRWVDDRLPIDLVKFSRGPGGKGLVLEHIQRRRNFVAERRPRADGAAANPGRGRMEVSAFGTFMPSFERLITHEKAELQKIETYNVLGRRQVPGNSAGKPVKRYRFVEYSVAGMKFLTRVQAHAVEDSAPTSKVEAVCIEIQDEMQLKTLSTFANMMFGGIDKTTVGMVYDLVLKQVNDFTLKQLSKPDVVKSFSRYLGKMVNLLKEVKKAINEDPDGKEWVLQWRRRSLHFGRFEIPEDKTSSFLVTAKKKKAYRLGAPQQADPYHRADKLYNGLRNQITIFGPKENKDYPLESWRFRGIYRDI